MRRKVTHRKVEGLLCTAFSTLNADPAAIRQHLHHFFAAGPLRDHLLASTEMDIVVMAVQSDGLLQHILLECYGVLLAHC
jgi:hypothetical protein